MATWVCKLVQAGRSHRCQPVQSPALTGSPQSVLLQIMSRQLLNFPRAGDSTASLGTSASAQFRHFASSLLQQSEASSTASPGPAADLRRAKGTSPQPLARLSPARGAGGVSVASAAAAGAARPGQAAPPPPRLLLPRYLARLRGGRQAGVRPVVPAQRHHAGQDLVVELQREHGHQHDGRGAAGRGTPGEAGLGRAAGPPPDADPPAPAPPARTRRRRVSGRGAARGVASGGRCGARAGGGGLIGEGGSVGTGGNGGHGTGGHGTGEAGQRHRGRWGRCDFGSRAEGPGAMGEMGLRE